MEDSIKSFPFPVLGNGDDINGQFNPVMKYTLEPNLITIDISFELKHETIEDLIGSGSANYLVETQCGATFFRSAYSTTEPSFRVEIPSDQLRDEVVVSFYICSTRPITNYDPVGVHIDLAGDVVDVETGDILAVGGYGRFFADKDFDPLKAPVSSFMKIMEGTYQDGPISIEYDGEQILIQVSKNDYKKYQNTKSQTPHTLHASLVLVALTDVLYTMNSPQGKSNYSDQPWFGRIQQICRERNINPDEPLTAAQKILGEPLARSLRELQGLVDEED